MTPKQIAKKIWDDLCSRSGFDNDIDEDTKKEILADWAKIIKENI
jgi:hypothetical protein